MRNVTFEPCKGGGQHDPGIEDMSALLENLSQTLGDILTLAVDFLRQLRTL